MINDRTVISQFLSMGEKTGTSFAMADAEHTMIHGCASSWSHPDCLAYLDQDLAVSSACRSSKAILDAGKRHYRGNDLF